MSLDTAKSDFVASIKKMKEPNKPYYLNDIASIMMRFISSKIIIGPLIVLDH